MTEHDMKDGTGLADELVERLNPARTGASMARGKSEQSVGTPRNFLDAVERRFGPMAWDLAAESHNAKAPQFITPEQDSLIVGWPVASGNLWLNPPYNNIAPWAAKCHEVAPMLSPGSRIFLLVPASIGSNWFAEHVYLRSRVIALQGRLTFEGHTQAYPKDLILAVYGDEANSFEVWKWRVR